MTEVKHPTAGGRLGARLFVAFQYGLPQHGLSRLMLAATRLRLGAITHWLIRRFIARFDINLSEALEPRVEAYPSINAFFTRALAPGARPLPDAADDLLSPVDGAVSALGSIADGRLLQCKGHAFALRDLLGGSDELAEPFAGGLFATLYLSPRDYHRIHMPITGRLTTMVHVPGRLFSVNPVTVAGVPDLFARNERVICLFETAVGPMAVILVGAIFVGGIETRWAGVVTPPRGRELRRLDYGPDAGLVLERGAEMGRFNMGSTVILLLPAGRVAWATGLAGGSPVRCRGSLAKVLSP